MIANENGTTITLNGDSNSSIDLEAGDNIFIEGDEFLKNSDSNFESLSITSNNNIYVFQGTGKKGDLTRTRQNGQKIHFYGANQGMFFVPPLSCTSVGDVKSIAQIDKVDENSNFSGSLFVLSSYGSSVKVNGDDILSLSSVVFDPALSKLLMLTTKFTELMTSLAMFQLLAQGNFMSPITMLMTPQLLEHFILGLTLSQKFIRI